MSAPHSYLERLLNPPRREVRIAHTWGHGDWFDIAEESRLRATASAMNAQYGAGTHRLEYR